MIVAFARKSMSFHSSSSIFNGFFSILNRALCVPSFTSNDSFGMKTRLLLHEVDVTLAGLKRCDLQRDAFFGMKTWLSGRNFGRVEKGRVFRDEDATVGCESVP